MRILPLHPTDERQRRPATLGTRNVIIRVWWQELTKSWYLSLYNENGYPIALSRQIATNARLLRLPDIEGDLYVVSRRRDTELGRDAWGAGGFTLVYLTEPELQMVDWR